MGAVYHGHNITWMNTRNISHIMAVVPTLISFMLARFCRL